MGKLGPKNQNCQFKLKYGTETNSNMQNSMVIFTFLFPTRISFFEGIWSKKSKLSVSAEPCYLDEFKCVGLNGGIHFRCGRLETPFFNKFDPKNQNC